MRSKCIIYYECELVVAAALHNSATGRDKLKRGTLDHETLLGWPMN